MQVKCLIWHDRVMIINKMLLIFCSVFTLYNWLITFHVFFPFFARRLRLWNSRFENVINDSFNYTVTRHRWNCREVKNRIFRSALVLSSSLIHVLAHFQRITCSQIYFRFSSYLRKPLLRRSTAFICNIDHDWMIYRKHPIRSLLTSMLRKTNIRYSSDVYALSYGKYTENVITGNFSKTKMYC